MASGADQEDLERKFRDYMQSFAEKGHLACPVCGELAWEYDSSSLATANPDSAAVHPPRWPRTKPPPGVEKYRAKASRPRP